MLYQNHTEEVAKKRDIENQDELKRTNITPEFGKLPTFYKVNDYVKY